MKKRTMALLIVTHCVVGVVGFGAGIYVLPILTAPPSPSASEINAMSSQARYTAEFKRELKDSDTLHWVKVKLQLDLNRSPLWESLHLVPTINCIFLQNL